MQTAAGGPLRIKFTPEQIAQFESYVTRVPGMNNSGGNRYREEGVQAQQHQEQETKRKEEEIKSRMEMRPTLKRKVTTAEKLQGKKDEYEQTPQIVGMSGADPLFSFYVGRVGLNGIGALAKTGLWNIAKYAPTTQLGNWGRQYFVGNTFKNSFNGTVPTFASQATSLLYQPVKQNESRLTSLKFFERKPSKISEAERVGVPKGERDVWDPQVMLNAKEFANKYGYEVPQTIEEIKNMYRQHNRFFRSVETDRYEPKVGNTFFEYAPNYKPGMSEEEVIYGLYPEFKGLTPQQLRFTLASRGYPLYDRTYKISDIGKGPQDDFVFVSPSLAENAAYANSMGTNFSNTVMLQRPFSFGKPADWHINADWRPSEKVYKAHTKGQVSEGNSALKNEAKISTKHLIPVKIAEKGDLGTLLGDYLEKQKYKGSLPYKINIPINKQGGKMNILEFLKNGSGIHIKKKNRGKFTSYCGGKVTDECIRKAKASGNPTLVKRATFAANARKWKHKKGGILQFLQQGNKIDWAGMIGNFASQALQTYAQNKQIQAQADQQKEANNAQKVSPMEYVSKYFQEMMDEENRRNEAIKAISGTTINPSNVVGKFFAYQRGKQEAFAHNKEIDNQNKMIDAEAKEQKSQGWMNFGTNLMQTGIGIAGQSLSNKGTTNAAPSTTPTTTGNSSTTGNSIYKLDSFWEKPYLTKSFNSTSTSIM